MIGFETIKSNQYVNKLLTVFCHISTTDIFALVY